MRWGGRRTEFVFLHLPPPPYTVEVRIHGHVGPVLIDEGGTTIGEIATDRFVGRFTLAATTSPRTARIVLRPTVLRSDPALGAQIDRIRILYGAPGRLPVGLALVFVLPALGVLVAGVVAGLPSVGAAGGAILAVALQSALLWPDGLVRSPYAIWAALLIALGAAVAAIVARWIFRAAENPSPARSAFVAVLVAAAVQILVATHPHMVVSDVVFHANKLAGVGRGEWFPTSQTQHAEPFRIPYGVSFYGVLSPLSALGIERVNLVRWGAAVATFMASVLLIQAWGRAIGATGIVAVAFAAVLPRTIDLLSFGNLSNLFGQAATVALLAWWLGPARHVVVGVVLVALAGTAHLSSLIVLVAALVGMCAADRASLRPRRLTAAMIGLIVVALYYAPFTRLVVEQLPRLVGGGGSGSPAAGGVWSALVRQSQAALGAFGWPALVLAALGLAARGWRRSPAAVRGYGLGVLFLALPAIVSPVEVRYILALGPVIALLAAFGLGALWHRGAAGKIVAGLLAAAQVQLLASRAIEAVLHRYRI